MLWTSLLGVLAFKTPFKDILQGTPKVFIYNVIEPAMGGMLIQEVVRESRIFVMNTFAGASVKDCSKRLARGY